MSDTKKIIEENQVPHQKPPTGKHLGGRVDPQRIAAVPSADVPLEGGGKDRAEVLPRNTGQLNQEEIRVGLSDSVSGNSSSTGGVSNIGGRVYEIWRGGEIRSNYLRAAPIISEEVLEGALDNVSHSRWQAIANEFREFRGHYT